MDGQTFRAQTRDISENEVRDVVYSASVVKLTKKLGLTLCHQSELSIRRIKRGTGFSFVTREGRTIRQKTVVARLNALAVPPAYIEVRYSSDAMSHLQAIGRDAAGRLQYRYHPDWEKVRGGAEGEAARKVRRCAAENPPGRRAPSLRQGADQRIRALRGDRTDRADSDPARKRIVRTAERHARRDHLAQV